MDTLKIFKCSQCDSGLKYDLPLLTEHIAKEHLDGFCLFECSTCKAGFATGYLAAHHLITCEGNLVPSPTVADFTQHIQLSKKIDVAIKNAIGNGNQECVPQSYPEETTSTHLKSTNEEENEERKRKRPKLIPHEQPRLLATPPVDPRGYQNDKSTKGEELTLPGSLRHSRSADRRKIDRKTENKQTDKNTPASPTDKKKRHRNELTVGLEKIPLPAEHLPESNPTRLFIDSRSSNELNVGSPFLQPSKICDSSVEQVEHVRFEKNVDLMTLPEVNPDAAKYTSKLLQESLGYNYYNYFPSMGFLPGTQPPLFSSTMPTFFGPTPTFPGVMPTVHGGSSNYGQKIHRPSTSKLTGPMTLKNMNVFDVESVDTDLAIIIRGTMGNRTMHFSSQFMRENSPFLTNLLDTLHLNTPHKKIISLDVSLTTFLDVMNILHGKGLPWKFECRHYYQIVNLFRVYKMLKLTAIYGIKLVQKELEEKLFAFCAPKTSCDCTGCIERVVMAKHFGFPMPKDLAFTQKAASLWIKDCPEHSCAPELGLVDDVSTYLQRFL